MTPAGGQGANASIWDALALADVLDAALRAKDVSREGLLPYERLRRPVNERSVSISRLARRAFVIGGYLPLGFVAPAVAKAIDGLGWPQRRIIGSFANAVVHARPAREIDLSLLNAQMEAIQGAGDAFISAIPSDWHMGNGMAGAAAVAGLKVLRRTGVDLTALAPGTVILADVHGAETNVFKFIELTVQHLGLARGPFWKRGLPSGYKPTLTAEAFSGMLEKPFDDVVARYDIWPGFHPFVAAYTAVRSVEAAYRLGYLHSAAGIVLVSKYVVAGARTVPVVDVG